MCLRNCARGEEGTDSYVEYPHEDSLPFDLSQKALLKGKQRWANKMKLKMDANGL